MTSTLVRWLSDPALLTGLAAFSVLALVASMVLVPRFLASLPADYISRGQPPAPVGLGLRLLRNFGGAVLVLLGLAMLVLPGQGLLTLLVGVSLVEFPGKQRLMRAILARPQVLSLVNRLRARRHAVPLA